MKLSNRSLVILMAMALIATAVAHFAFGVAWPHADVLGGALMLANAPVAIPELKDMLDKQFKAWEDFKSANDERIKAIESKGYAPSDLVGKVDAVNTELNKLSAEISEIVKKMQRPGAADGKGLSADQLAHKNAMRDYLREGKDGGLQAIERKAMNTGSDPDGGYLVDEEMDTAIDRVVEADVAMRRLATVRVIGKGSYKKFVKTSGLTAVTVGEGEDSAESTGVKYAEIEIKPHRSYVEPWVTNEMLEDAEYDLEADLTDEAGIAFAEYEGNAFINGTGVGGARGFLQYSTVANASYAWGKVGFVVTGGASDFAASNPGDAIISLQHALKSRYRNGAAFLANDATLSKIRQMKDGSGAFYLWQPDPSAGFGGRLLGAPLEIDDYMPSAGSNNMLMAYGNWRRGYTIVDRRGVSVIRDALTKKGVTKFHFSKRVGGGITNFEAIKLLKCST